MLVGTQRHAFVRQVGHGQQQCLQIGLDLLQTRGGGVQLGLDRCGLRHHGVHFGLPGGAFGLELANLLAQRIAFGLQLFSAGLNGLALGFQRGEGLHVEESLRFFAGFQARNGPGEVFSEVSDV